MSTKGKYKDNWEAINSNKSFEGAHTPRQQLEDYLMTLVRKLGLTPARAKAEQYNREK